MYWIPFIIVLPYLFMLLRVWRNLKKIKKFLLSPGNQVFVSVIIPCRNGEPNLLNLLNNLARQDYPGDLFEVLVVDDKSTDALSEIVAAFNGIINLTLIKNTGTGKKSAIRSGVNFSSGQLIITTDADCIIKENWLKTICSFFDEHMPDLLICPVQLENKPGFFGRFQELEFLSLQGITAGSAYSEDAVMCNGANLAFKRKAYFKHTDNLHDEILSGDDIFFLQSLKKEQGSKIMWLESIEAKVTAAASTTLKEFLRQRKRWLTKGKAYNDRYTILLAIVTFVTNILILSLLIASLFNSVFFIVLITVYLVKAIPDFLILSNTTRRYERKSLMKWFLPSELVYPFYIFGVATFSILTSDKQEINSPSRKGI